MRNFFSTSKCTMAIIMAGFTIFYGCTGSKNTSKKQSTGNQQAMHQGQKPGPPPDGQKPGDMPPPPNGMPPGDKPHGDMPPNGMPPGGMHDQFDTSLIEATYEVHSTIEKTNATIVATKENESAVVGLEESKITLDGNKIKTSGNTSSNDFSSFQGLNAAVLGRDKSAINMHNNYITTTGIGANGIFAYGHSIINTTKDTIDCFAGGGHGIMASGGGTIHSKDTYIITRGRNSGAVATDRGSGTITVDGGYIEAQGADSPGIYSTGKITSTQTKYVAKGAEVAVIEGSNSIICNNCDLLYNYQDKWGVMIYQSFSGDAEGVDGHFEMNGGSLKSTDKTGPLFFVTNSNANIYLNNVEIENASDILFDAHASRWGHNGTNGGNAVIHANSQKLTGNIVADKISTVSLELNNHSVFNGGINTSNTAKDMALKIDKSSYCELTQDSYVSVIEVEATGDNITNIKGNGHTLYYSKDNNPYLKGKTYKLLNKGLLKAY